MPKTKFESFIFSLIMVFFMVYCMTTYSIAHKMGGLSYPVFVIAISEMWLEYVIVFALIFFVISHLAQKMAFRIVTPGQDKPIFIILAIQCFTVLLIVPAITLIVTFLHGGADPNWLTSWLETMALCFPAALILQVFFVGPLVRWIFRMVMRRGEAE